MRDSIKLLQGRLCVSGEGEGREGKTLTVETKISTKKYKKSITQAFEDVIGESASLRGDIR